MPTTVITGRDVTFTLDSAAYDAQTTSAVLSCDTIIETYQTLDGRAYKSVKHNCAGKGRLTIFTGHFYISASKTPAAILV